MTTPTQAQIEAAAKAIYDLPVNWRANKPLWFQARYQYLDEAKAALTAAAQVGEQASRLKQLEQALQFYAEYGGACAVEYDEDGGQVARQALDATQVGEPYLKHCEACGTLTMGNQCDCTKMDTGTQRLVPLTLADLKEIEVATIERCAQVAEKWGGEIDDSGSLIPPAEGIAAAIRKLKDENG